MSKILITGDWHLSDSRPRSRIDDYLKAQKEKIQFIFDTARKERCQLIIQPGDLCDSFKTTDSFKVKWINFFNLNIHKLGAPSIVSVYGQHDMRYHTGDIDNTPLGVLRAGIGFNLIEDELPLIYPGIDIYGAGWGKPVPKILRQESFNILITHRLITDSDLWPGAESYDVAGAFLRKNNFKIIVSGDNHKKFVYKNRNRYLFNCGSLMRSKIDQFSHKPAIFILDLSVMKYKEILIPIEKPENVFSVVEFEKEKEENRKLDELRDVLKRKTKLKGLDYKKRVKNRVEILKKSDSISRRTERFIEEIMG